MSIQRSDLKVGDIVRVKDCHHFESHFYEVSSIDNLGVYSEPAHYLHRFTDIVAVYRLHGDDLRCCWLKRSSPEV